MSTRAQVRIDEAQRNDLPEIRKLLPRAFRGPVRPALFAARDEQGRILGAAAVRVVGRKPKPRVARFRLRVAEDSRRQGIATALLERITAHARSQNATRLVLNRPVDRDTALDRFLIRSGFRPAMEITHFESEVARVKTTLKRPYHRLTTSGRVPADARIIPLSAAPPRDVRNLVLRHFGGRPLRLGLRIQGNGPRAFSRDHSVVLTIRDQVRGAMLLGIADKTAQFFVEVVEPSLRGGWANLLLLHAAVERAGEAGAERIRFAGRPATDRTTIKMARRTGAVVKNVRRMYSLDLAAG